jgi:hypothetical protein
VTRGRGAYSHDFWLRMVLEYIVHACGLVGEFGHFDLFGTKQVDG